MQELRGTLASIGHADDDAMAAARHRWNSLAKPVGGLGMLEDMVVQLAGVFGTPNVRLANRTLIIMCADNGVVRRGVSASDASVTRIMARALGEGVSTANHMARAAGCDVLAVDVGMLAGPALPGVLARPVRVGGTDDIASGPAMSRDECVAAVELGIDIAREHSQAGCDLLLTGEMGIGNTTSTCAMASSLLGLDAREVVGPGTGLAAEGLARKVSAVQNAVRANRPDASDPLDVLAKVGGLDIAAICGLCLGSALYRVPVLLDGIITLAGALAAVRLCPDCRFALLASHVSAEPVARALLEALGLRAPLHAGMHLGEGTGALATLPLLDVALEVYRNGSTLDDLAIDGYKPEVS